MFNGGMATTSAEIELPDVEPAAFLALLRFLYSDEVQIGPETVMTTLYTAKKYAVPALEAHCVEFLTKHLRADNAFMLLTQSPQLYLPSGNHEFSKSFCESLCVLKDPQNVTLLGDRVFTEARLFDEPQLASLCLDTIDKNTMDAISAEGFTDIDIDTLCAVLERDTLSIRECRLFGAVVRWAEAECQRQQLPMTFGNKQKVLGKALALIRFPLMTIEEFAADGDCSHEIKRCLLLGRKVMTNLDSIFKSRDITLPTKVCLVKAMVFPAVMYGCESWTVKKAECRRIDAFELRCWRRLLSIPWTARRSSQSILKEISPGCSLEGLMLKLKLQYFGHLM